MKSDWIQGAQPRTYTSKTTFRDTLNIEDIEGARPLQMKGYSGLK